MNVIQFPQREPPKMPRTPQPFDFIAAALIAMMLSAALFLCFYVSTQIP